MTLTVDQLEQALVMLRRQGVKSYNDAPDGGFHVEFFPPEDKSMPESKDKKNETDVCQCGHPEHAHMNGFCVEGCFPEKCGIKAAKTNE